MTDIIAVFRVDHPDLGLTETLAHDGSARLRPIRQAGRSPGSDRHLFAVHAADFETFEAGLEADPTVAGYEQVVVLDEEAVYAIKYDEGAMLFSTEIGRSNGVILNMEHEGTTWILKAWFPNRRAATEAWQDAVDRGLSIELERINEYGSVVSNSFGLTPGQQNALLTALEAGYFDEPRGANLGEVAAQLDISEPAASGLLRRALKRLVLSTIAEEGIE
jgi:predicted DNA binding protein